MDHPHYLPATGKRRFHLNHHVRGNVGVWVRYYGIVGGARCNAFYYSGKRRFHPNDHFQILGTWCPWTRPFYILWLLIIIVGTSPNLSNLRIHRFPKMDVCVDHRPKQHAYSAHSLHNWDSFVVHRLASDRRKIVCLNNHFHFHHLPPRFKPLEQYILQCW